MSLINEALKKAQRQRTGETPLAPGLGDDAAMRGARRHGTSDTASFVVKLSVGLLLSLACALGGLYLYNALLAKPTLEVVATATSAPTKEAATPPLAAPPAPAVSLNASPASQPIAEASGKAVSGPSLLETTTPATTPPLTPTLEPPAIVAKVASPTRMSSQAINYLDKLRVSGIRASTSDSKVLMNDRVYRAGDIVDHDLGLKLIEIKANSLTFEDESGLRHTRSF